MWFIKFYIIKSYTINIGIHTYTYNVKLCIVLKYFTVSHNYFNILYSYIHDAGKEPTMLFRYIPIQKFKHPASYNEPLYGKSLPGFPVYYKIWHYNGSANRALCIKYIYMELYMSERMSPNGRAGAAYATICTL